MTRETNFYRLEYIVGQNRAEHFAGARWNVDEFEWDPLDPLTYTCEVTRHYECTVSSAEFDVDCWMYSPHICGSQKLINLLESVGARYRAIGFDLFSAGRKRKRVGGQHYIVLILDDISMMDSSKSEYEVMVDLQTGAPVSPAPSTSHPGTKKFIS